MTYKKSIVIATIVAVVGISGTAIATNHNSPSKPLAATTTKVSKQVTQDTTPAVTSDSTAPTDVTVVPVSTAAPVQTTDPNVDESDTAAQQVTYDNADRLGYDRDTQWTCMQWLHINTYPTGTLYEVAARMSVYKYAIDQNGNCLQIR